MASSDRVSREDRVATGHLKGGSADAVAEWRPKLYVMIGIQGSGKTTQAKRLFPDAVRVSLDDIRMMVHGRDYDARFEDAVSAIGAAALNAALVGAREWCRDVVFDATNVTRALRKRSIHAARAHGADPIAVYVRCDLDLALERNSGRPAPVPEDVVRKFSARMEPPSSAEGFVDVLVIDADPAPA